MCSLRDLSDHRLLAATGTNPDAFAVFYRRHLPAVLAFLMARTGDREVTADLSSEVFAAALESRARFDPERGSASAWLCTIARNKLIDSLRRGAVEASARRRLGFSPIELDDHDLRRIDDLVGRVPAGSPLALLEDMPDDVRSAVTARVLAGRSYADIAAELRCSECVVRKRVSRGLAAMRVQLEERP